MSPQEAWKHMHDVVMEVPSVVPPQYEQWMPQLITRIKEAGPHVTIFVQPSIQRKTTHVTWMQRWNRKNTSMFKMQRTCSCCLGDTAPGCHIPYYVGSTRDTTYAACKEIETMGVTDVMRFRSLGGAVLLHLQPFARSGLSSTIMLRMLGQIHTCCDPPDHKASKRMLYECLREGAERAPDSTSHLATDNNPDNHTGAPLPQAFPTEAKEKERENRNRIKAAG